MTIQRRRGDSSRDGGAAFKLIRTADGRLEPIAGTGRPGESHDEEVTVAPLPTPETNGDADVTAVVRANRERIEELRQRRYGVSLRDDLSGAWLPAAVVLVILALVARAVTRAIPSKAHLVMAASILLVLVVTLVWGIKRRFSRRP